MTYEKMRMSIKSAFCKTSDSSVSGTEHPIYRVVLHIDPEANNWNRAAIKLSHENTKVPSRRQKVVCYPRVPIQDASGLTKMSTNEWNDLALGLRNERCKEDGDDKIL